MPESFCEIPDLESQLRRLIAQVPAGRVTTYGALADGLGLLTFAYFDDTTPTNNAIVAPVATSSLADIPRITISLVATDTVVGAQQTFPLVVDVRLRN